MARLVGFTQTGADAICAVHAALSRHAPNCIAHFDEAVVEVRFAPDLCQPGAAGCARRDLPCVIVFALPPEHMTMAELGRVLTHEARHWQRDREGSWYVLPHQCGDAFCTRPAERAGDFVYATDAIVLPYIEHALRSAGYRHDAPWTNPPPRRATSPWGGLAAAAAAFVAVVVVAKVAGS